MVPVSPTELPRPGSPVRCAGATSEQPGRAAAGAAPTSAASNLIALAASAQPQRWAFPGGGAQVPRPPPPAPQHARTAQVRRPAL